MAFVLCLCKNASRAQVFCSSGIHNLLVNSTSTSLFGNGQTFKLVKLQTEKSLIRQSHSFLSRVTAEQLWKGVTTMSEAAKRKGAGKRSLRKVARDLNRGQVIGFGKKAMLWPGLNSPIIRGKEIVQQQELPPDNIREQRIIEMRDRSAKFKAQKIHPLERGWSGTKLPGRSIGPPDPIADETFEGFDSRVLEFKNILFMTGARGRSRVISAFVAVGNKNGLAGFALAKSSNGATAAKLAKNRAAQVLRYIPRWEGHTVLHDFHCQFGATNIFVYKKPEGYGLVCHRAIKSMCELIGIKNLYAKVEGGKSMQNLTKAFFIGLMKQKSPQQIAEEKGLHIVEMRREQDYFPKLIASPSKCRTEEEINVDEILDYNTYVNDGKVAAAREPYKPFYINFPSYIKKMKDSERFRNQRDVRKHLTARYGSVKSFLTIREEEKAKQNVKEAIEEK